MKSDLEDIAVNGDDGQDVMQEQLKTNENNLLS